MQKSFQCSSLTEFKIKRFESWNFQRNLRTFSGSNGDTPQEDHHWSQKKLDRLKLTPTQWSHYEFKLLRFHQGTEKAISVDLNWKHTRVLEFMALFESRCKCLWPHNSDTIKLYLMTLNSRNAFPIDDGINQRLSSYEFVRTQWEAIVLDVDWIKYQASRIFAMKKNLESFFCKTPVATSMWKRWFLQMLLESVNALSVWQCNGCMFKSIWICQNTKMSSILTLT